MLQKAPNVVIVCLTAVIIAAIGVTGWLVTTGHSASEVKDILGTVLGGLSTVAAGGAWLYASASAKSGDNVEKQLNGNLDARMAVMLQKALLTHDIEVHGANPTVPPPLLSTVEVDKP